MGWMVFEEEEIDVQGERQKIIKQTTRFSPEEWEPIRRRLDAEKDKFQRRSWIAMTSWARGEGGERHTHPDEQEQILAGVAKYVHESAWSDTILAAIAKSWHVKPEILRRHAESYYERKALKKAN